ncbi:GNAT family N-acetyltransferase [Angustibacter luteus]|uniref:GNAT family N-acetyltransferase n=1 Tax=Angustibacter luteus TaxID=658456 RepID=A0ABW1JF05_9ACTN
MSDVRIVELDPLAEDAVSVALLEGWVAVGMASARAEFGDRHTVYSIDEVREMQREVTTRRIHRLAAVAPTDGGVGLGAGGQVVGEAAIHLPLLDNTHFAALFLSVHPRWRRQGIGRALLTELERRAVEAGRRTLCLESDLAPNPDAAAYSFAPRHGYAPALVTTRYDLDLPDGDLDPLLAGLEAEGARHATEYDLLTWWDDVPDAWVDQRAHLSERMATDAPMGEVDVEEEVWDAERVRETFRVARAMGRHVVETVAVHRASGQAVAFTAMAVAEHTPDVAYQWDTLVLSEHRGHRLGQLVKAANLRALRDRMPAVARVVTWNADVNAPMLRVNRELGFAPIGVNTEWQKTLT